MHGLAVIHQRRHCLSMVISIWDARSTYLPICRSVSTVDQAVTLRCFESTRLPQSVLHASEPSSDFRRKHIADSIMIFLTCFRRDQVADEPWVILGNNRRNIILDFQHAGQNSMESG